MAELQELGVRVVEISASAAEMVFTMELNFERDKNGDVCKLHNTYIIHISKFMITRDHTLLISNPLSLYRPFGYLLFDIIVLIAYYGKKGLDALDDSYVDYLLTAKLNQESVHISVAKKCSEHILGLYLIV